jgi:hypothetical protein
MTNVMEGYEFRETAYVLVTLKCNIKKQYKRLQEDLEKISGSLLTKEGDTGW